MPKIGRSSATAVRPAPTRPSVSRPVAYVVSRFPKVSETFIVREVAELQRRGLPVALFSLVREREDVLHPEAAALGDDVHFGWPVRPRLLASQLVWAVRRPRRYVRAWYRAIRGTRRSPKALVRAIATVPMAADFARTMTQLDVAHVHAHWATQPALAALVIKELTGIPYSFTAHAHDLYVDRTMLEEKVAEAEFVVAISEYNRQLLAETCGPAAAEKVAVVRCGVDLDFFDGRGSGGQDTARPLHIVCVASLQPYKGHRYLIGALQELAARGLDFRCTLVGDGEERMAIDRTVSEQGLSGQVELVGARTGPEVREILASADVAVLSSIVTASGKKEGIPVALMEALAMEVPVVATRISGVPELVEDGVNGILVPPGDAHALARALLALSDDPLRRRQMGRAGRQKVAEGYDLHRNVERLHSLFQHSGGTAWS